DNGHGRIEGLVRQLEAHLVVAFARASVGHGIRPDAVSNLNLALRDDGARQRSAEQILPFVDGAGTQGGKNVLGDELPAQVLDEDTGGAALQGLLLDSGQLVALTDVGCHGNYFASVVFSEPRYNH